MKRRSTLTPDEHLLAFLDKWDAARAAQMVKHTRAVERYRGDPSMQICFEAAARRLDHVLHEMAQLAELRRRAFPDTKLRRVK